MVRDIHFVSIDYLQSLEVGGYKVVSTVALVKNICKDMLQRRRAVTQKLVVMRYVCFELFQTLLLYVYAWIEEIKNATSAYSRT